MKKVLSKIFEYAVKKRNDSYSQGKKKVHKCVSPVISVGNLSVGGAGKTPFVEYIAQKLVKMNFKPAIVGRGYKRKSKGYIAICDGNKLLTDAKTGGDEMLLLAEKCKVPVTAHDIKYKGALLTESQFDVDCIIIDDGFQHRYLFRDIDILLLDKETIEHPFLIPNGRLREPLSSIERADVVCMMGDFEIENKEIQNLIENKYKLRVVSVPEKPYLMNDKKRRVNKEIETITFSGIAKPENFKTMVKSLNFSVKDNVSFDDHHYYTKSDVDFLIKRCKSNNIKYLSTTEKDMVKIKEFGNVFAENEIEVIIFPLKLKFREGEKVIDNLLKEVLTQGK